MPLDYFLASIKYGWIPLLGIAYKEYKASQEKQNEKIEKLESKVSHQMTKSDVIEVVTNATTILSLEIKAELQKISLEVHQVKNQGVGKDATLIELMQIVNELNKKLDVNRK
jgi:hypothetical protein